MYCIQQLRATTGRSGVRATNGVVSCGQTLSAAAIAIARVVLCNNEEKGLVMRD